MKKSSIAPFSGVINLGMERGYKRISIEETEVITFLQRYQNKLIAANEISLSCSISESRIIFSGQNEKHLRLSFINYPKFPLAPEALKREIEALGQALMKEFEQNRIVIEYHDETVMFERSSDEIDPEIKRKG